MPGARGVRRAGLGRWVGVAVWASGRIRRTPLHVSAPVPTPTPTPFCKHAPSLRPVVFFYTFLPPLLLDSAARLDFFVFKKVSSGIDLNFG